jgi:hypothetical protein
MTAIFMGAGPVAEITNAVLKLRRAAGGAAARLCLRSTAGAEARITGLDAHGHG